MRRRFLTLLVLGLAIVAIFATAIAIDRAASGNYPSAFVVCWVAGVALGVAFVVQRLAFHPVRAILERLHATGEYQRERERARALYQRLLRDKRVAARVKYTLLLRRLETESTGASIDASLLLEIEKRMAEIHALMFDARCREVDREAKLWERLVSTVETTRISDAEKAELLREVQSMMSEEIDGLADKTWEYAPEAGEAPIGPISTKGLVKLLRNPAFREQALIRETGAVNDRDWMRAGEWVEAV